MSNRTNGSAVRELEEQFAKYVGAKYGIACCNGTATLHTALVALGVKLGDRVAVPPLTMASTTLAVLHAGGRPVFLDVAPDTWIMQWNDWFLDNRVHAIPVSLYGLHSGWSDDSMVDDAAETLNQHQPRKDKLHNVPFTSYSFQASKILSAGEGGMLVTNDLQLADKARWFSRLGYSKLADLQSLKHPTAIRHLAIGYNYRMSDAQAQLVLSQLPRADDLLAARRYSAQCYREAISGVDWITPQYVPEGWSHSYWTYAIALQHRDMWEPFVSAIESHGGERPYAGWRITYQEPAFRHLSPDGTCPVAENLQPRLVQLQTNHDKARAERAAEILHKAIQTVDSTLTVSHLTR